MPHFQKIFTLAALPKPNILKLASLVFRGGSRSRRIDGKVGMMGERTLIEAEESSLWAQCLSALRSRISESALNTWFSALEIVDSSAGEMIIGVPNGFVLEYVTHHFRGIIENTLEGILGTPVRV